MLQINYCSRWCNYKAINKKINDLFLRKRIFYVRSYAILRSRIKFFNFIIVFPYEYKVKYIISFLKVGIMFEGRKTNDLGLHKKASSYARGGVD